MLLQNLPSLSCHHNKAAPGWGIDEELDVIPASVNLTCPIKTQRAMEIVDRAKRGLLRERIGQNVQNIGYLKRDILARQKALLVSLHSNQQKQVTELVTKSHERMFTEVKIHHKKKLDILVEKNRPKVADSIDLSGKQVGG